jgi:hypothetical protein
MAPRRVNVSNWPIFSARLIFASFFAMNASLGLLFFVAIVDLLFLFRY